jgi:hypothetical protein
MKRAAHITFTLLLASSALFANGLEFRITISGKLMLGIAYRHQIDSNTAVRLGSYLGISGAPVGLHLGMVQDTSPINAWTPFFEIGADMLLFSSGQKITKKIYPSSTVGFNYSPKPGLKHSAELWLGYLSGEVRPVGLNYVHFNAVD